MKRKDRKRLNKIAKYQLSCLGDDKVWVAPYTFYYKKSTWNRACDAVIEDILQPTPRSWYHIRWKVTP